MIKTQILLWKTIEGQGLGLDLFYFILNSLLLTRDVTYSRLYLDGKNVRGKCQMNNLRILSNTEQPSNTVEYWTTFEYCRILNNLRILSNTEQPQNTVEYWTTTEYCRILNNLQVLVNTEQPQNTVEEISIENVASQLELHQVIKEPRHILKNSSYCFDLVFICQPILTVYSGTHPSLHLNCHHQIIYTKLNLKCHYSLNSKRFK